ncbi:site-specific DNA-methyltransferase [Actinobacillus equuli]|uniref:site-specific DNA-methyltransferase n=1 Tax=Actinobacillus equuli TaxID=718 RepID=UPI00244314A1|nr:site-specific DNA-methyltransferase [Actinobacillus equuli]WGE41432.1 site-specific DNA-methyltransferase [Actinobacillus equuli subsp. haemolyticus]
MTTLTWHGKEDAVRKARKTPYYLLREVPEFSHNIGDSSTARQLQLGENNANVNENLIIQGDNLAALKSLLPFYAGQVKCIFIDPPYNTKSAFSHYDDNLEHSVWLSMMYPRLELLRELLAEDGSIWITLDDNESHYCKIMCDEIFGRKNFVANVVWQHRKSVQSDIVISLSHNHILTYAKNINKVALNRLEVDDSKYANPDNDPRGKWVATPFDAPNIRPNLTYPIINPNTGETYLPPQGRCWRTTQDEYYRLLAEDRIVFGKTGKAKPQAKLFLSESQSKGSSIKTWWEDCGTATEATKELQKMFDKSEVFSTPKPERLIQRILQIATNEDDLVLDSFLGSGTTAAVAHKMNRRYIGIEIGEHAKTHVLPRLKKVIDGEQGGISKLVNWQGGGAFRFCELGETIFDEFGSINPAIRFEDLVAHIWYAENSFPLPMQKNGKKSPLVGVYSGKAFYLLYNGILGDKRINGGNVLTSLMLKELPRLDEFVQAGLEIVVYGEGCRLMSKKLNDYRINFKLIPHDVLAK